MMLKRGLLFCCLALLALLAVACMDNPAVLTPTSTRDAGVQSTPLAASSATGTFYEYSLPQTGSGIMRPAIDHKGRIWFGEMGHNYLGVFDPRTHTFEQRKPPNGSDGIMGVQVARDDTIWFAEQYADYIGHYIPDTGQYQVYSLPTLKVPDPSDASKTLSLPSAPNDIALDAQGNIWFTELNADSLGKLDPHTGQIQQFPLAAQKSVQKLDPYGVAVDPRGMIWFTESINNHVGRLDPSSGKIRYFTMPGPANQFMEIASDAHGIIWITSFNEGLLTSLDPRTGTFTPYYAPATTGGGMGAIYGLTISPNGEIWVTITAENLLARLDVAAQHFVYYHIPTQASQPFGVVMSANHTLWFTESGSDKIGMLQP
jgi:streptogramin lyase